MADDQDVVIVDGAGTEHHFPAGFDPKRAAAIVRQQTAGPPAAPAASAAPYGGIPQTVKDFGIGAMKGLGSTVASIGEGMANAGMIPGAIPSAFNSNTRNPIFQKTDALTTAANTPQRIGKIVEQVGEAALPVTAGIRAVPSTARAGQAFQAVMGAARNAPVDMTDAGNAALRISELGDRGGTTPRAVTKLLRRITDPGQAPITYEEARDWASNISRLSADEFNRLPPTIQREMGNLRTALNGSIGDAAGSVGMKPQYQGAMQEYADAAKLQSTLGDIAQGAKRALPYAIGGGATGAGYSVMQRILKMLNGSD